MKTLTAFYDLDVGPVSFDFVVFAVKAELERKRVKADRLHIVIVPGMGPGGMRDKSDFYDQHEAKFRLWNICIPACALIGASVTLAVDWEQAGKLAGADVWPKDWENQTLRNRPHLIGGVIEAAKAELPIPRLSASEHALRTIRKLYAGRRVVTMTLRTTYLNERNTDLLAWEKAAEHIRSKGFCVAQLLDVSAVMELGCGFGELNLDLRMAMYQEAELNLQANNGSASLCWFSDTPYRMFDAGVGDTREEWRGLFEEQGLPWGTPWPWASPQQRIVYERSTADVIIREFEAWTGSSDHRNG